MNRDPEEIFNEFYSRPLGRWQSPKNYSKLFPLSPLKDFFLQPVLPGPSRHVMPKYKGGSKFKKTIWNADSQKSSRQIPCLIVHIFPTNEEGKQL